jgi:C4-dicarboxylate-specific signal transduction histidine kinase
MVALLYNETAKYAISIQTTLAQDIPHVMGDGVQLQQVLMNLIVNSIEAMKDVEDGTREVAIKSLQADKQQLMVSVSDMIRASGYPRDHTRSSMPSLPPSCIGPAWDFGLAAPSSNLIGPLVGG